MIVAFDPGVTTGVAWLDNLGAFHADEYNENDLYMWVDFNGPSMKHAQIEQFVINEGTMRKTRVYDSLYIIGYLRYAAVRDNFTTAFTKPADVMASFPDAALKRAKMHTTGKGHANDAARHLAHHLVRTGQLSGSVFLPKG